MRKLALLASTAVTVVAMFAITATAQGAIEVTNADTEDRCANILLSGNNASGGCSFVVEGNATTGENNPFGWDWTGEGPLRIKFNINGGGGLYAKPTFTNWLGVGFVCSSQQVWSGSIVALGGGEYAADVNACFYSGSGLQSGTLRLSLVGEDVNIEQQEIDNGGTIEGYLPRESGPDSIAIAEV